MINYKLNKLNIDTDIRQVGSNIYSIGGILSKSKKIIISGSTYEPTNLLALNAVSGINTGDQLASTLPNDSTVIGLTVKDSLNNIKDGLDNLNYSLDNFKQSTYSKIENKIQILYTQIPDVILTTSGANDLNNTISSLESGQLLEVRSNAIFSHINIPSGVSFAVKVADGYFPTITGVDCIRLDNGASNVILSSLIIENCSSSYGNGVGSAIGFTTDACIVNDIIFHNLTIRNASESAVMLSYNNRYNYALAPTLSQMSSRLSFIGCHFHKATTDKIEGSSLNLRGVNNVYIKDCYIDSANQGRGIQLQDCINSVIENNYICNCNDGNGGEGIKIDEIGVISGLGYRNSAIIKDNIIKRCIEGIDIDDATSCNIIQDNIVSECIDEGISLDGGNPNGIAAIIGNICYKNNNGIRLESGSQAVLKQNVCYANTTNFLIENGYSLDDSNTTSLDDTFESTFGIMVKNDSSVSGTTITEALNYLNSNTQKINSGTVRPIVSGNGVQFFDETLGYPIWKYGSNWVNASGTIV